MAEPIKMLHFIETDTDLINLEEAMKDVPSHVRDEIIKYIVQQEQRIIDLGGPTNPFDGRCPGCGRKDC
jgi:hypothetical protein